MSKLIVTRRNGDRHTILFDDADEHLILPLTWCVTVSNGKLYAATSSRNAEGRHTLVRMHRFLTGVARIDHINGNGLDNRRSNLRMADARLNSANAPSRKGTSRYKGVSWNRQGQNWQAHIMVDGKSRLLGKYDSEADAALAYDVAALKAWGEFALLNFPRGTNASAVR